MHMDLFVIDDLKTLMGKEGDWSVSMYMPTHRVSSRVQEDQIRFKNLVREAEEELAAIENGTLDISLEPAHKLLEDMPFWQYRSDGLAVFLSADLFRPYRLPLAFDELVVVTDRFHTKPLLPLLSGDGRFYLLALSQNEIRLLHCTRSSFSEVDLRELPGSLKEALWYDDHEKHLQYHTGTPAGPGGRAAIYHGQGVGTDDEKDRILRFFRAVDEGLGKVIQDKRAPMVLAAVDYLQPIFKQATKYPVVLEEGINGNPEEIRPAELHAKAWEIIHPYFQEEIHDRTAAFKELIGTGKASDSLEEIVKASYHGRVKVLFVAVGTQSWGSYEPSVDEVTLSPSKQPQSKDLLDLCAAQALLNGGTVYAMQPSEMPVEGPIAAILRY